MNRKLFLVVCLCLMILSCVSRTKVPVLIKALGDEEGDVRAEAASALGHIGEPAKEAVPALIKTLGDKDKYVRGSAALALREIGTPEAMKAVE